MKKLILLSMIFSIIIPSASANAQNPTVFKLGFLSFSLRYISRRIGHSKKRSPSGRRADQCPRRTQMPWGKVKIEVIIKDDEAKLDVGVRRFRKLVAEGINGLTGTIYAYGCLSK